MKITVKNLNEEKSNETKKNNLVFDRKNEIQMYVGDILVFYISKNVEIIAHWILIIIFKYSRKVFYVNIMHFYAIFNFILLVFIYK